MLLFSVCSKEKRGAERIGGKGDITFRIEEGEKDFFEVTMEFEDYDIDDSGVILIRLSLEAEHQKHFSIFKVE